MTDTQMSAITSMNLTSRDVMELVQSLGTTTTASSPTGMGNDEGPFISFSGPPGGGGGGQGGGPGPGGGGMIQIPADGGGIPPDALNVSSGNSGDEASNQRQVTAVAMMADTLLDPLISMLQEIITV